MLLARGHTVMAARMFFAYPGQVTSATLYNATVERRSLAQLHQGYSLQIFGTTCHAAHRRV